MQAHTVRRDRHSHYAVSPVTAAGYLGEWCAITDLQPGRWVDLLSLPHPLSHDQALLLCQCEDEEWLAWIPDHGEMRLNTHQFCC